MALPVRWGHIFTTHTWHIVHFHRYFAESDSNAEDSFKIYFSYLVGSRCFNHLIISNQEIPLDFSCLCV